MAGAGIDDDTGTNIGDAIENPLGSDGVAFDSLQEADSATVATLADQDGDGNTFPEDQDTRTAWDDDVPRRRSYAAMANAQAKAQATGSVTAGDSVSLKAPLIAGFAFLALLGIGAGALALLVDPPGPPATVNISKTAQITGDLPQQGPVDPDPTVTIDPPEPLVVTVPDPITPNDNPPVIAQPDDVTPPLPTDPSTVLPTGPVIADVVDRAPGTPPGEPVSTLQEASEFGPLPVIAANGMRASIAYARRVPIVDLPRISIVMTELGLDPEKFEQAVRQLPADVSLAFHPYAPNLNDLIATARLDGHESLLALPMQPINYPFDDPGPNALLINAEPADNITALYRSLGAAEGYVGVTSFMGSALLADAAALNPIIQELARRGLLFIDSNTTINSVSAGLSEQAKLPYNRSDRLIDSIPTAADIDEQLMGLESLAKLNGHAIGYAQAYPVTFQRLEEWLPLLKSRGIDLVPVSATIGLDNVNPS